MMVYRRAWDRCTREKSRSPGPPPAQQAASVKVAIKRHLVGLQQIGAHDERPAVRQLGVSHLQLGALTAQKCPILAPVELEGLARRKG